MQNPNLTQLYESSKNPALWRGFLLNHPLHVYQYFCMLAIRLFELNGGRDDIYTWV